MSYLRFRYPTTGRVRKININVDNLPLVFFLGGPDTYVASRGFPLDGRVLGIRYDDVQDLVSIYVESGSFSILEPEHPAPILAIEYHTADEPAVPDNVIQFPSIDDPCPYCDGLAGAHDSDCGYLGGGERKHDTSPKGDGCPACESVNETPDELEDTDPDFCCYAGAPCPACEDTCPDSTGQPCLEVGCCECEEAAKQSVGAEDYDPNEADCLGCIDGLECSCDCPCAECDAIRQRSDEGDELECDCFYDNTCEDHLPTRAGDEPSTKLEVTDY